MGLVIYLLVLALLSYTALLYESGTILLFVFSGIVLAVLAFLYLALQMLLTGAELSLPVGAVVPGGKTELVFTCCNRGIFPVTRLRGYISVTNVCTGERKRLVITSTAVPGKTPVYRIITGTHCGRVEYRLRKIRIYDLTGIFCLSKHCDGKAELAVMPLVYGVSVQVSERSRHFTGESDIYDERKAGPDASEMFSVRPFQDGDRIQNIHWKLSVRTDTLMVRENSFPLGCPVVLFVEPAVRGGTTGNRRSDAQFMIAASVSLAMVEQGCAHYIAWYDVEEADAVRMRVDREENLYEALHAMYAGGFRSGKDRERFGRRGSRGQAAVRPERIAEQYREKYRTEQVMTEILISREAELIINGICCRRMDIRKLEEELGEVELIV